MWHTVAAALVCFALAGVGCKRQGSPTATSPAAAPGAPAVSVPAGWKVYTAPEGDFSVAVPADPSVVRPIKEKEQVGRVYVFRKGDAELNVMIFERTGAATQRDKLEEIRAYPQVVAGSLREVSLAGMRGLEFRRSDPQEGECVHRVYRSPDGSRAVSLRVVKPQSFSAAEVRAFLDSFKILR